MALSGTPTALAWLGEEPLIRSVEVVLDVARTLLVLLCSRGSGTSSCPLSLQFYASPSIPQHPYITINFTSPSLPRNMQFNIYTLPPVVPQRLIYLLVNELPISLHAEVQSEAALRLVSAMTVILRWPPALPYIPVRTYGAFIS